MATRNEAVVYVRGEDQTARAFSSVSGNLKSLAGNVAGVAATITGLGLAIGGLAGAVGFRKIIDEADAFSKLSQKTGIATEELSAYRYATELSGVSSAELETGLLKLTQNMAKAAGGVKLNAEVFDALNIQLRGTDGALKRTDVVLGEIADAFASFRDGPEKAALAIELFGKSGATMIPFLNTFRDLTDEGKKFGAVYGADFARQAEAFNDNLTRLGLAADAAKVSFFQSSGLLDALSQFAERLVAARQIMGGFAGAFGALFFQNKFIEVPERLRNQEAAVRKLTDALAEMNAVGSQGDRARASDIAEVSRQLQHEQKILAVLNAQLRIDATAAGRAGDAFTEDPIGTTGGGGGRPTRNAPVVNRAAGGAAKADALSSLLRAMDQEIEKTQELSKAEQVLLTIRDKKFAQYSGAQLGEALFKAVAVDAAAAVKLTGEFVAKLDEQRMKAEEIGLVGEVQAELDKKKYRFLSEAQRESIVNAALELQMLQDEKKLRDELAGVLEASAAAQGRRNDALNAEAEQWRNIIEPTRVYTLQLERIDALQKEGKLDADQALNARFAVENARQDLLDKGNVALEKMNDNARQFGLTMQSAFEDAVIEGQKFDDVVRALEKDLLRMLLRVLVTEQVARGASTFANFLINAAGSASTDGGTSPRAHGGNTAAGQTYLVGERGPELFRSQVAGAISPAGTFGGPRIVINNGDTHIDARADAQVIRQAIRESERRTLSQVQDAERRGRLSFGGV